MKFNIKWEWESIKNKNMFDFLNKLNNDQSLFISEQQTHLVLYFDTLSDNHNVVDEGISLNFTGTIGNSIEVSNFILPQLIYL